MANAGMAPAEPSAAVGFGDDSHGSFLRSRCDLLGVEVRLEDHFSADRVPGGRPGWYQVLGEPGTEGAPQPIVGEPRLGPMDRPSEIRDFLTSRRARVTPEQAGVPTFAGVRRVPGLRREEVAHAARDQRRLLQPA